MNKTILLGATNSISNNAGKWLLSIIGALYLGLGSIKIYEQGVSFESVGWLVIGACFLIYGLIIYSATSLTPKVKISDTQIEIKNKIFGKATRILWTDIQKITFAPYTITFRLKDKDERVTYSSSAETSIEIKSSIREVAENKNIQVEGG